MNVSRLISLALSTAMLSLTLASQHAAAQQYKKITRLGTSQAVCSGGIETAKQLQDYFASNPSAIKNILSDAGWSGNANDLLAAVAMGEMTERSYPVGTRFQWTGVKKNGLYVANKFREWAGSESFEGFQINLRSNCQVHHIAIPKACCNVSLVSIEADTSAECVAPNQAATSTTAVAPASESLTPTSQSVAPASESLLPPTSDDLMGLVPFIGAFVGTETRPRLEPRWQMDKRDSSGVVGVRAGLLKALTSKTSLVGQVSYLERQGVNGGNVYPEENFSVDVGVEHKLSQRSFIGAGVGAWDVDDSDFRDATLYGIVGGDIGASNLQWFLEGRVFDSDSETLDSISSNRMFSAGIRYLIK